MTRTFNCPACSRTISAEVMPGAQVQCPLCNQVVTVPDDAPPTMAPSGPTVVSYSSGQSPPPTLGLATGAMICGIIAIVTCVAPLGIVALILGIVALNKIRRRPEQFGGRGFAITGICTGALSIMMLPLMISILLPSLSRARELSKRTVCAANMRGIGQAMYIYAQDDPQTFPAMSGIWEDSRNNMRLFDPQDRTTKPSPTGTPSPTVDMWAVVRTYNTMPSQFICPSTADFPDPAMDVTAFYDFAGPSNLSYAYQYQHSPRRRIIGTSSEPTFPFMADANPYIKGGITAPIQTDRLSQYRGNSMNHSNREGQNVIFQDAHVSFEKGPDCGLSGFTNSAVMTVTRGRDHIYTVHAPDPRAEVDPGMEAPTFNGTIGTCNLGGKSDACLVP